MKGEVGCHATNAGWALIISHIRGHDLGMRSRSLILTFKITKTIYSCIVRHRSSEY